LGGRIGVSDKECSLIGPLSLVERGRMPSIGEDGIIIRAPVP